MHYCDTKNNCIFVAPIILQNLFLAFMKELLIAILNIQGTIESMKGTFANFFIVSFE